MSYKQLIDERTIDGILYQTFAEEEYSSPQEYFDGDEEVVRDIERQYNQGNFAAWFCAHVVARIEKYETTAILGHSYLGACSYHNFAEFLSNDDYFTAMRADALDRLKACLAATEKAVEGCKQVLEGAK